jgi:hypothetical protein
MPAIVPREAFDLWLDCTNVDAQTAAVLITPAPEDLLEAYEVSNAVNRTSNDGPEITKRAAPAAESQPAPKTTKPRRAPTKRRPKKKDDGQGALF